MKKFITAQELLEDSYLLADKILGDEFKPDFIIGIWRGGAPIGIAVQEYLKYFEIKSDHIPIRTSSYIGREQQKEVAVHGLKYIVEKANNHHSLLLVDDIFDSGRSIKAIIDKLKLEMRANLPRDIRVATIYYKPNNNKTEIIPNYYIHKTDEWIIFPHELEDMSMEEIRLSKSQVIANLIEKRK